MAVTTRKQSKLSRIEVDLKPTKLSLGKKKDIKTTFHYLENVGILNFYISIQL